MQIFTIILFLYNIPLLFINQWKKKNKLELIVLEGTQQMIEYYLQINFSIVSNRTHVYLLFVRSTRITFRRKIRGKIN